TEPLDPDAPPDADPVLAPEPPPAAADPAAEPGLAVTAGDPGFVVVGAAADPVADPACVSAVVVTVDALVALAGAFTAAFLPPPPHAANAAMTAMHNRIRRTQRPPHR